MGFKLKLKNVQRSSSKASPFKINESLVMGAGTASKGFANIQGGFNQGLNNAYGSQVAPLDDDDTENAEGNSKRQTCEETGLTGDALKQCQDNVNQEFLDNEEKKKEAEAKAKKEQACKDEGFKNCAAKERGDEGFLKGIFKKKDKTEKVLDDDPLPASNTANE
jgi:hypothetical protein|tara:strand:+ start:539 stop:1030 length:492 start_codon:yes stop_codon:yes gene_type:complete